MGSQLLGKTLVFIGLLLAVAGAVIWLLGRVWPARGLPGDLHFHRGNVSVFFPLTTCLLISVVLTILLNLLGRWLHR